MVAPVIPAINDAEIERILDAAALAGVKSAGYVLLRLPLEVRDLFKEWLMANYPDRFRHVMKLMRDMRGGKDYNSTWGKRRPARALCLDDRAALRGGLREARAQQGQEPLTTEHFQQPIKGAEQLSLFWLTGEAAFPPQSVPAFHEPRGPRCIDLGPPPRAGSRPMQSQCRALRSAPDCR